MSHTIHLQAVTCALQAAYPNIPFRVSHDAIGIFIYYTANAAGAPDKEPSAKCCRLASMACFSRSPR